MIKSFLAISPDLLNWMKLGGQVAYTLLYMGITWQLLVRMEQRIKELKSDKEKSR